MSESDSLSIPPPRHVAIIMDGNGRWAQQRGLSRSRGHEAGAKSLKSCLQGAIEAGVEYVTFYAFSSENWKRPAVEVKALMILLEKFLDEKIPEMMQEGVKLLAIGYLEKLPASCRKKLQVAIEATADNRRVTAILALNYGAREEIVGVARKLAADAVAGKIRPDEITTESFSAQLDTAGIPDPDLLIRTSGEMRISNFLLWQISYAEIFVTAKLWPDFSKEDFLAALAEYARRDRRFGA